MKSRVDRPLESWLEGHKKNAFPFHTDYAARYRQLSDRMHREYHEFVDRAALLAEVEQNPGTRDTLILLTHHGSGHVNRVIERASDLLQKSNCTFSPYEAYILLVAIHFHDVANALGRLGHGRGARQIMAGLGEVAGTDRPEKNVILSVAEAHCKTEDGKEDTIGPLLPVDHLGGQEVRPQFLAAVLRFADELSDDKSRADAFLLDKGRIPRCSEVYHGYSVALHSVFVGEKEAKLSFEMNRPTALKEFGKGSEAILLVDEILARTLKMYREAVYCNRFTRPHGIGIDRIEVKIEVLEEAPDVFLTPLVSKAYRLEERGYPDLPRGGVHELCPELGGWNGELLRQELLGLEA